MTIDASVTSHPQTKEHVDGERPDYQVIKTRQQAMWASGDFAVIGTTLQIVGEDLCEAADLRGGQRVLDVACGNGNAALAAARRFCEVTGLDYVPALLERARERARSERFEIALVEGDAEAMPFEDGEFEAVLSTYGVMFAPDQERAAKELVRVCAVGGSIALASWTPEGFIGELLKVVSGYVPPPKGVRPTVLWGSEPALASLFGDNAQVVHSKRKMFNFRYRSAAHFVQVFRDYYGPTHKAFQALDAVKQSAFERDLLALISRHNRAEDGTAVIPAEYLESVFIRR